MDNGKVYAFAIENEIKNLARKKNWKFNITSYPFDFIVTTENNNYLINIKPNAPDIGTLSFYTTTDSIIQSNKIQIPELELSKPKKLVMISPGTASPSAEAFAKENDITLCPIKRNKDIGKVLQDCLI